MQLTRFETELAEKLSTCGEPFASGACPKLTSSNVNTAVKKILGLFSVDMPPAVMSVVKCYVSCVEPKAVACSNGCTGASNAADHALTACKGSLHAVASNLVTCVHNAIKG